MSAHWNLGVLAQGGADRPLPDQPHHGAQEGAILVLVPQAAPQAVVFHGVVLHILGHLRKGPGSVLQQAAGRLGVVACADQQGKVLQTDALRTAVGIPAGGRPNELRQAAHSCPFHCSEPVAG